MLPGVTLHHHCTGSGAGAVLPRHVHANGDPGFRPTSSPYVQGSVDSISLAASKALWVPENQASPEFSS